MIRKTELMESLSVCHESAIIETDPLTTPAQYLIMKRRVLITMETHPASNEILIDDLSIYWLMLFVKRNNLCHSKKGDVILA